MTNAECDPFCNTLNLGGEWGVAMLDASGNRTRLRCELQCAANKEITWRRRRGDNSNRASGYFESRCMMVTVIRYSWATFVLLFFVLSCTPSLRAEGASDLIAKNSHRCGSESC